ISCAGSKACLRRGLIAALEAVRALPAQSEGGGRTDLAAAVGAVGRIVRHRGAVILVSDFPQDDRLGRELWLLGRRHDVIAIEVRDRRERELPRVGHVVLRDVETGRRRTVNTGDRRFQERFARRVAESDRARATALARAGARHAVVETGGDWVGALVEVLGRERRRAALAR
ncbi:MAG TPA: hypothetical protein PKE32_06430, partial [Miltoncostaeaceae bacterium]|nr:hypothetical protein [Miltoncostaeaceae bacterium]